MRYRERATGKLISAREVRRRAGRRKLPGPPVAESRSKSDTSTIIQVVFLPTNEERWDQYCFDLAMADPVIPHKQPDYDKFSEKLTETINKIEGSFHQAWRVEPRYPTLDELRTALITEVKRMAAEKMDAGILVGTIPVRTDAVGIARLIGAVLGAKTDRKFVFGDQSLLLPKSVIDGMSIAVDDYVQGCYDRLAELIDGIKESSTPLDIDLETGWP